VRKANTQGRGMYVENRRGYFKRRMMMFESMIERILMYGEEIWGWKEKKS
jgi:hypothetical protein